jgi:hypothetical protein
MAEIKLFCAFFIPATWTKRDGFHVTIRSVFVKRMAVKDK